MAIITYPTTTEGVAMYGSDHLLERNAATLALTAFTMSNVAAWGFMILVQYFVFKILHSKHSASSISPPTTLETYALVGVLWIIHRVLDAALYALVDGLVWVMANGETVQRYDKLRAGVYNLRYWAGSAWGEGCLGGWIALLGTEILATWLLSQTLLLVSDTLIPLFLEFRLGPQRVLTFFLQRVVELGVYIRTINWREDSSMMAELEGVGGYENKPHRQAVEFERHKGNEKEGRTLDWKVLVDKEALNEMMETLGPPGGFGELGFMVGKDRVGLGAMGKGTSFTLTFELGRKENVVVGARGRGMEIGLERTMWEGSERERRGSREKRNKK